MPFGRQRTILDRPIQPPAQNPYRQIASFVYDEQEGKWRQFRPAKNEIVYLYMVIKITALILNGKSIIFPIKLKNLLIFNLLYTIKNGLKHQ